MVQTLTFGLMALFVALLLVEVGPSRAVGLLLVTPLVARVVVVLVLLADGLLILLAVIMVFLEPFGPLVRVVSGLVAFRAL